MKLGGRRDAVLGLLGQRPHDDRFNRLRDAGLILARGGRRLLDLRPHQLVFAGRREQAAPGQHLVQHDAQRVNIGAAVDLLALNALGGHVFDGSHHGALPRHAGFAEHAGDAEIGHLDHVLRRDHDIRRLDVAVQDAHVVRVFDTLQGLAEQRHRSRCHHRFRIANDVVERGAVDELHHHVEVVAAAEEREERGGIGMVQLGEGDRLTAEARQQIGLAGQLGAQALDRHLAVEHDIDALEDGPHAAFADLLDNLVVPYNAADHGRNVTLCSSWLAGRRTR